MYPASTRSSGSDFLISSRGNAISLTQGSILSVISHYLAARTGMAHDCIALPRCMQHMLGALSDTPIETSAAWQGSSRPAATSPSSH